MNCIELTITAHAPLAIGRQKPGDSVSEAESYIPGSVIRGAIAAQILQVTGRRNTDLSTAGGDFQSLFLDSEAAVFQNAYPAIARLNSQEAKFVPEPICVLPATAVSSKNNSGFKIEGIDDVNQKGGVFDTVIDRYCAGLCGHSYDPSCPKDCERVEPLGGFYSVTGDSDIKQHRYRSHRTSTRILTRVGINRRRATAQDKMLYSIEVLNESFLRSTKTRIPKWEYVAYRSHIWVKDKILAEALTAFIKHHSESFRMGGGASRGLGSVVIDAVCNSESDALKNNLKARIQQFNQALHERWNLWSVMRSPDHPPLENRTFFTLDLQSEAILNEHWQRTMVVSPQLLQEYGINDTGLRLDASYASYDYRAGWNAAWGLMKETELVTNRGAVFLFSTDQPEQWKVDEWVHQLTQLEIWGVGDRTSEGFGQVRICDSFHTIFRENAV